MFWGNGEHANPDLDVLQLICDRRLAQDQKRFKFWFNSSSTVSVSAAGRAHMKNVESLVTQLVKRSKGRLTAQFITSSSMQIA